MKKCPYCAEAIQTEAKKCRYCGEWLTLTEEDALNTNQSIPDLDSTPVQEHKFTQDIVKPAPMVLHNMNSLIFILFIILIPVCLTICDVLVRILFNELFQEVPITWTYVIIYSIYFMIGAYIANFIYRYKKSSLSIFLSLIMLLVIRLVVVALSNIATVEKVLAGTVMEALGVFVPTFIFIAVFRYFEPKYQFAEIQKDKATGILAKFSYVLSILRSQKSIAISKPRASKDSTKKELIYGTCNKCGEHQIISTASKGIEGYFDSKAMYFCKSCGLFMHGNPLKYVVLSLNTIITSLLMILALGFAKPGNITYQGFYSIMGFVGLWNGIKGIVYGVKGIMVSKKAKLGVPLV